MNPRRAKTKPGVRTSFIQQEWLLFLLVCICGDQVFGFWYTESCFMLYSEAELKDPNHHFHEEERKGKEQEEENSPL